MRLFIPNAGKVLKRAWSVRFIFIGGALIVLDVALPAFEDTLGLPPRTFAILSGACSAAAFAARFLIQPSISGDENADR